MDPEPSTVADENLTVPGVAFFVALAVVAAVNLIAGYLEYRTRDNLLLWSALGFLIAIGPSWFVPGRYVAALWAFTGGAWLLALRFTGDIGPDKHISGGALLAALLPFTLSLAIKTHFSARAADTPRQQVALLPPHPDNHHNLGGGGAGAGDVDVMMQQ